MIIADIFVKYGEYERTNTDFLKVLKKEKIEEISEKSGVKVRKICSDNADAISLSRSIIETHNLYKRIDNQDLIIVVSECVYQIIPPPSSLILCDIEKFEGQVIDLNRGCSGFVEAIIIADSYFKANLARNVLIIAADSYSKHFGHRDPAVGLLGTRVGHLANLAAASHRLLHSAPSRSAGSRPPLLPSSAAYLPSLV